MRISTHLHLLSRFALLLAGTALGVALLVYLLRSVNLDQLGSDFARVDPLYLAVAVVPFLLNLLLKVPRWALLFGRDAPGWDTLFGAMNVGYAVNALLPARLGEVVRAYWVRDRSGVPMVQTLSTIALERVVDGVTLIVLLLAVAPTVAFPGKLLGSALVIGTLFVLALIVMAVLARGVDREDHPLTARLDALEGGRWSVVARVVRQIMTGVRVLGDRRALALVGLYTLVIWVSNIVLIWLVLRAFHVQVPLTAGAVLTSVLNLGMAVPSSPGYLGVFDGLMVLTLGLYGVRHTPALAAALAFHVVAFVPVTLIGLAYIARSGLQMTLQIVRATALREGAAEM